MITVKITQNSIHMSGHAGRKESNGIDRACTAVSALTCNLINSLSDLTGDKIRSATASGMTVIEWEELSEKGKFLIDSWFLGIATIDKDYNCIIFL